jgi:hypothetical protein
MSTTMVGRTGRYERRVDRRQSTGTGIHVGRVGIGTVGFLTILISAWGGIVPYVGPVFGYSADGTGSWDWTLSHSVLALIPGILGVMAGFFILSETRGVAAGRGRVSLTMAGLLAALCGAWFVIGAFAWPVITTNSAYFVAASPLRALANIVGYGLGTGVILATLGGFAIGWAARHQPVQGAAMSAAAQQDVPMATSPAPVGAPAVQEPVVREPAAPTQEPVVQEEASPIVSA